MRSYIAIMCFATFALACLGCATQKAKEVVPIATVRSVIEKASPEGALTFLLLSVRDVPLTAGPGLEPLMDLPATSIGRLVFEGGKRCDEGQMTFTAGGKARFRIYRNPNSDYIQIFSDILMPDGWRSTGVDGWAEVAFYEPRFFRRLGGSGSSGGGKSHDYMLIVVRKEG